MNKTVLPADTFIVINKTILTEQDRKIITMLYQPIIGSITTNLFFTFWSYLDKSEIMSEETMHHQLMTNMKISLDDIIEARLKLEAIGLLKTYLKKGSVNNYIYELFSPLSAYEFFSNPILDVTLLDNIGLTEYNKLVEYFKFPNIKTNEYEDITCSFTDVFEQVTKELNQDIKQIKKINKNEITLKNNINLNRVLDMIPDEMLNKKRITKETKNILEKLSFIYNLEDEDLFEIMFNSIDEENLIDIEKLKMNCRNYYSFEHKGKNPGIIYKQQPENLRKEITDLTDRTKMMNKFDTISPYEFLYEKNNYTRPTDVDMKTVEYLLLEQNLNPGVVNVLIDYVLRINNNKLTRSFVTSISSQWVRNNVKTVEEAMILAEKEHKSKNTTAVKTVKHIEKKPNWFDKNIEESLVSEEEQLEFEQRLKNMK